MVGHGTPVYVCKTGSWTAKISTQNTPKMSFFELKSLNMFWGEGTAPSPGVQGIPTPLGTSIRAPLALDLGPPMSNHGSATVNKTLQSEMSVANQWRHLANITTRVLHG